MLISRDYNTNKIKELHGPSDVSGIMVPDYCEVIAAVVSETYGTQSITLKFDLTNKYFNTHCFPLNDRLR